MKTTIELELPDVTFRRAKSIAARQGISLKQLVTEAIEERLRTAASRSGSSQAPWMKLAGTLRAHETELRRIQGMIDQEFERIEPE